MVLGAILSRGIVGASPFGTVAAAGAGLVTIHRIIAVGCIKYPALSALINGKPILLYTKNKWLFKNMDKCSLSEKDVFESLRLHVGQDDLAGIKEIYMERSGRISFVRN